MRISFLVRRLGVGGAERQLIELARGLAKRGHQIQVVTFYKGGGLAAELLDVLNIEVHSLDKGGRWDILGFTLRLIKSLRAFRPDVLHSYMEMSNILASLIKPLLKVNGKKLPVVWGIRTSMNEFSDYDWSRRLVFHVENFLARYADKIIFNSVRGLAVGVERGMSRAYSVVIRNGVDTHRFSPSVTAREQTRATLGLSPQDKAIGIVARLDPVKNHETFIEAARLATTQDSSLRFLIVGSDFGERRAHLTSLVESAELGAVLKLIGEWSPIADLYPALDIFTLCSKAEGFPNTVAEAMACGVPAVVTDVGDCRDIVGSTGVVVPAGDPAALAQGWLAMASSMDLPQVSGGEPIREQCRRRIQELCSLEMLAVATERELASLLNKTPILKFQQEPGPIVKVSGSA